MASVSVFTFRLKVCRFDLNCRHTPLFLTRPFWKTPRFGRISRSHLTMAQSQQDPPYREQDPSEIRTMLSSLEAAKGKGGFSCKKNTFPVDGSDIQVDSWKMQDWDYKKPNLPTYARGLFTTTTRRGDPQIAVRGYDKFFNQNEVRETEWKNVRANTCGPYELSVKENGCIIFLAGLEDGKLLVCSKHSTGNRTDINVCHARAGEEWVEKHLARVGKSKADLAAQLRRMNATAVAELCDDEFEEHVLAYAPNTAGLYLHGINLNLPDFVTYPHHLVDRFAEEWGFRKTTYLVKHDIDEVKSFLDGIADTGAFDGRDTEGFVIRCQSKANTGQWHDWFFKYKFEEPYLMYRQWRECTKAVISEKVPSYKKHKKITDEYLVFAKRKLHANPGLAQEYQHNHGIIKMRDDFLASCGLKGTDIIRQEEAEAGGASNDAVTNIVLVTIATLGCGKTTVALALCKLFGWGHVQNDNITVKKGKPVAFAMACTRALANGSAVVADRNNHQRRERKQLIEDVSNTVPSARFVALHYVHDRDNWSQVRQATQERVLARGDNHQTIHVSRGSQDIINIMDGFMHRFEPVDSHSPPDDRFDLVIDLDPCAPSRKNLDTVVNELYDRYPNLFADQKKPTARDMDRATDAALQDYTVAVDQKHQIAARDPRPNRAPQPSSRAPAAPAALPRPPEFEFFAVHLRPNGVRAVLDALFAAAPPETAATYHALRQHNRLQPAFHVTLLHRADAPSHPEYWDQLCALSAASPHPALASLGPCSVRLERLVWDARVMAFVARLIPPDAPATPDTPRWRAVAPTAHVTVGTVAKHVRPVEANALLARWVARGPGVDGVREALVEGTVEVEGTVRGVLRRR